MAEGKPWEKYQKPPEKGPWEKYAATGTEQTPAPDPFVQAPPQGPPLTAQQKFEQVSIAPASPSPISSAPSSAPAPRATAPVEYQLAEETFVDPSTVQPLTRTQADAELARIEKPLQPTLADLPELGRRAPTQPALQPDLQKAEQKFYDERFAGMDLPAIQQYKELVLPKEMATVKGMEQGFLADKKAIEGAFQELNALSEQALIDPSVRPEVERRTNEYRQMVGSLNKQAMAIEDAYTSLERDARLSEQREYAIKSGIGSLGGATRNEFLSGIGELVAGLNTDLVSGAQAAQLILPEEMRDKDLLSRFRKGVAKDMREAPLEALGSKETTPEYIDQMRQNFLGGAWLGLVRSAPGMATPFMSGIGFQTLDSTMEEMSAPQFEGISEEEKMAVAVPIAAVSMALERFGFKNLAQSKTIAGQIVRSGLGKLPKNATGEQIENVMNQEVRDWASRYVTAAGTGAAAEFETGALQELSTDAMKELYNFIKEDEKFETPDGWGEYIEATLKAGAQEAVGGFIMSQPHAVSQALRGEGVGKMTTPEQFKMVEGLTRDPNYKAAQQAKMEREVEEGVITPEQKQQIERDWDEATKYMALIPDDLPAPVQQRAFDLIAQREALKKKDATLVADKVEAINEELRSLPGIPQIKEPTTNADGTTTEPEPIAPTGEEAAQTSVLPEPSQTIEGQVGPEVTLTETQTPQEDAVQIEGPASVGTYPGGQESAGRSTSSEALGQGEQGQEPAAAEVPSQPQVVSDEQAQEIIEPGSGEVRADVRPEQTDVAGADEVRPEGVGPAILREQVDETQPTQQAPTPTPATPKMERAGVPDKPPAPPAKEPTVGETPKRGKRATAERLLKEHPELKEVLTDDAVHYERIPNKVSYDTAKALVEATGYDEAAKAIIDGVPMRDAVRNMVGRIVTEHYRKEGNREKLRELTEEWFATITDAAQGLAALHTLYGDLYDAETLFYKAQREVQQRRKTQDDTARPKTERVAKGLRKINEEGAEEVIRTRRIRQKVSDASESNPTERTTDPPSYGAKNRVVTKNRYQEALKRMRGQMNSGISPEMIVVAAYHIEAGSRSFAAVAERVTKRLGKKALPYLKGAYKEAFSQLKRDGVDVGEPSSDEEINDYIAKELSPQALKDGLKALDLKIDDIIRKHWSEQEDVRRSLADKFIQDAGLGKEEAEALANAVQSEFDKVTRGRKEKLIRSLFSAKERVLKPRKIKGIEDDIILMSNIGAFSDADLVRRYGDAMGFAQMTEKDILTIQGLAENIQKSKEGLPRLKAIQDLVAYQADMRGMSFGEVAQSVWYANMLSGFNTHLVNFFANLFQVASEFGIAATRTMAQKNRKEGLKFLAKGLIEGGKKGWLEAGAAWRTGRAHLKDKIEAPAALERVRFWGGKFNPANALKYVRRAMVAADVLGYETSKEMRAYQMAVKMANFDTENPSMDLRQKALDILNRTDERFADAKEEAQQEYEQDVEFAKSERDKKAITEKEYQKALKDAERDRKRRVFELVETGRPEEVQKQSSDFGSRTTYNYKPEGFLGALTNAVNAGIEQVPALAYIIPFRNIIANVANEAINYTPWGFARAASARGSVTGSLAPEKYKESLSPKMTPEQLQQHKLDLVAKASMGIALTTALFVLSDPGDDDDPIIEVTGNGYADWKKNMALKETGWQPYSIKVGNKWYSYQYTPLVLIFGMVGNYRDAQKYRKEKINDAYYSRFAAAMGRSMAGFLDMTWLTTADKVLEAVSNPSGEGTMDDLMKEAQRIGKTFVVPAMLTQASREVQAMTETPQKDTKGTLLGEILKDIPVLRNDYQDAINALGEPIVAKTDRFISTVDPDPVWNLFADKAYALSTPNPNGLTVMDGGKERVMTPKERHDYLVSRGQYIREKIEQHFSAFEKMDKEKFADEMRKLTGAASKRAKAKLVLEPQDPDVMKGPWFER